jgi:ankyrin repeat protein
LDYGADVNSLQRGDSTPLHAAARHDRPEVVQLLLDRGASPKYKDGQSRNAADIAVYFDILSYHLFL